MELRYGAGTVRFELPPEWEVEEVAFRHYPVEADPVGAIRRALAEPLGTPPLSQIVRAGERVCILVNDSTRKARSELFLPLVLEELNRAGVRDEDVFLVFATGSHRQVGREEMATLVGREVAARVAMFSHDCHDAGLLTFLGTTSRGTPVYINSRVVEADRRILTGSVVHHWFAGFGGGRKALVPGVAGYETIRRNHALMLEPGCRAGVLDGNPAAEDMMEAARLVGADFLVNTVLNPEGDVLGVFAGDMDLAHREACRLAHRAFAGYRAGPADLVIASCGGWPKDINVYQSHKALENAALVCRPGGVIILVAECREGIGSDRYWEWVQKYPTLPELERAIREEFVLGGHKAWAVARITARHPVVLLSSLDAATVSRLGFLPASTPEEALAAALRHLQDTGGAAGGVRAAERARGERVRVVVMPLAGLTVPLA
ncbi:MAG: nickel-dependent lactate racemase [Firmicutes bacterium]|nr:nickel-dependent lactate racemase [Bacillota bacterium]